MLHFIYFAQKIIDKGQLTFFYLFTSHFPPIINYIAFSTFPLVSTHTCGDWQLYSRLYIFIQIAIIILCDLNRS